MKSNKSFAIENLTARNVREQLRLVDTRCEAGCRHQANGDDKLAAIDTLGCYFGEGAGTKWGRKLAAMKGTRGSIRAGEEGTRIKRRRSEERSHDNHSMITFEDYIFHPFVVIKLVLFPCHSRASYICITIGADRANVDAHDAHPKPGVSTVACAKTRLVLLY